MCKGNFEKDKFLDEYIIEFNNYIILLKNDISKNYKDEFL